MVDVETILASLYTNEINVSLEWRSYRGFQARLGDPAMAEQGFRTSGEALPYSNASRSQARVGSSTVRFIRMRWRPGLSTIYLRDLRRIQ